MGVIHWHMQIPELGILKYSGRYAVQWCFGRREGQWGFTFSEQAAAPPEPMEVGELHSLID